MTEQITLEVDLPEVTESPIRIEVSCGTTTAEVYEHGSQDSGDWAAWKMKGYTVGEGGTINYTLEQALADAYEYVRDEERRRLLHRQLRDKLAIKDPEGSDDD